ncbi:MAG: hypothetical protein ACTSXX_14235 [Candidatus Baldrarchaeia archaeon]
MSNYLKRDDLISRVRDSKAVVIYMIDLSPVVIEDPSTLTDLGIFGFAYFGEGKYIVWRRVKDGYEVSEESNLLDPEVFVVETLGEGDKRIKEVLRIE